MAKAQQQGTVDALCGIYAILHFLRVDPNFRDYDQSTPEKEAFWCTLEAAEKLHYLTAHYMFYGYSWYNLKNILDKIIQDQELPYDTHSLAKVANEVGTESFYDLACKLLPKGCYVISNHSRGTHWVLVRKLVGEELLIDNSSGVTEGDQRLTRKQCSYIDVSDGVVIMPSKMKLEGIA